MRERSRRGFQVIKISLAILALALLITAATHAKAILRSSEEGPTPARAQEPRWEVFTDVSVGGGAQELLSREEGEETPPPPDKDPCLHCHIGGSNENLWTPLARWTLFGTMGAVFAFGIYRSASIWVKRAPWKPIPTRIAGWLDSRYQVLEPLEKVLKKPVPTHALHWWYCLGGVTAFLFVIQAVTGVMLAFYYQPTPEGAYASIAYIETQVRFGAGVRAIHHWAANGMIVMCIAHMLRVFITGAFKPPRELNWVSGVILLVTTLAFGFTGYLLPWDQRAYWATTVGSEIAGSIPVIGELALVFLRVGWDITARTLSRFYALHILVLPLLTVTVMGLHFLMVRRQGIAKPL